SDWRPAGPRAPAGRTWYRPRRPRDERAPARHDGRARRVEPVEPRVPVRRGHGTNAHGMRTEQRRCGHCRADRADSRDGGTTMTMTDGWRQHLDEMEEAIASGQAAAAVRAWHRAHAAVIDHPGWQPIASVAQAARRIGAISGFGRAAEAR